MCVCFATEHCKPSPTRRGPGRRLHHLCPCESIRTSQCRAPRPRHRCFDPSSRSSASPENFATGHPPRGYSLFTLALSARSATVNAKRFLALAASHGGYFLGRRFSRRWVPEGASARRLHRAPALTPPRHRADLLPQDARISPDERTRCSMPRKSTTVRTVAGVRCSRSNAG